MPFAPVADHFPARPQQFRTYTPPAGPAAVEDALTARRRALEHAAADKPLSRVAALLMSISQNNGYEGRDPSVMPETLTSGFVADLLGLDIGSLANMLVELRRRGLVENDASSALRLRDIDGLKALAEA